MDLDLITNLERQIFSLEKTLRNIEDESYRVALLHDIARCRKTIKKLEKKAE